MEHKASPVSINVPADTSKRRAAPDVAPADVLPPLDDEDITTKKAGGSPAAVPCVRIPPPSRKGSKGGKGGDFESALRTARPVFTTSSCDSQLKLPIYWVGSNELLKQYCEDLATSSELGVDCETTMYHPQICCLLQIACRDFIVLIDMLRISDFHPLRIVLEDPNITIIAHSASFEKRHLAKYNIHINAVYDTLKNSRRLHKYDKAKGPKLRHKLGIVCKRELNLNMDKGEQTSDWYRRPLSKRQLMYAALDAEVLLQLYDKFNAVS